MKKVYKMMLVALCAVLLVAASVMGTLAYLQMKTDPITNTFAVGNVSITLQEYKLNPDTGLKEKDANDQYIATSEGVQNIKLVPGRTIHKNPFITVNTNSEKCYLFVKVDNGLGDDVTISWSTNWVHIGDNYWMYNLEVDASSGPVNVFKSITCNTTIKNDQSWTNSNIVITAYAVQSEGFADATAAWNATFGKTTP